MNILKKIIRIPKVIVLAFWEVLKYIWHDKRNLLIPFILAELTYWTPMVAIIILSVIYKRPVLAASFYSIYVGILPAIPIQISITFIYYAIFRKIKGKNNGDLKKEADSLIARIRNIR